MSEKTAFERMAAINVSEHIEKKNGLSYLSWPWAVDQLLRADASATWSFDEPIEFNDTMMVSCTVTAFNKPMTMQLPVMDYRNKAISNPDAFAVNTAMMRCLVKAIALHGLGLYIYAGEDLPEEDKVVSAKHKPTAQDTYNPEGEELKFLQGILDTVNSKATPEEAAIYLNGQNLDTDEKIWVWDKLDSKTRSGIKKYNSEKKESAA